MPRQRWEGVSGEAECALARTCQSPLIRFATRSEVGSGREIYWRRRNTRIRGPSTRLAPNAGRVIRTLAAVRSDSAEATPAGHRGNKRWPGRPADARCELRLGTLSASAGRRREPAHALGQGSDQHPPHQSWPRSTPSYGRCKNSGSAQAPNPEVSAKCGAPCIIPVISA
jgi:hypothetical protein